MQSDITKLLIAWNSGDEGAVDRLIPMVYNELHRLARSYISKEKEGHTLQPTALVNEAYLKLVDQTRTDWRNRAQFFGVAAMLMRRILVDHARKKLTGKRGKSKSLVALEEGVTPSLREEIEILELDEALKALAENDDRRYKVVELKYFGGLTFDECAEVLSVSRNTVVRDWQFARAWLFRRMSHKEKS